VGDLVKDRVANLVVVVVLDEVNGQFDPARPAGVGVNTHANAALGPVEAELPPVQAVSGHQVNRQVADPETARTEAGEVGTRHGRVLSRDDDPPVAGGGGAGECQWHMLARFSD
jgi:hypothetical protein